MSTRLKRKLGDIGVDVSSRKATENFCLIGTPLPPLEKSKDTGEFVPLWKQDVRDEKGRRRLHGAFTGGWSAGYFNTVGSKEGWAPSTFVSSRSERASKKSRTVDDYMDDEDVEAQREARVLVDGTEEMEFPGSGSGRVLPPHLTLPSPLAQTLSTHLLPPPSDSVGAKILNKMGWKLGMGLGPRVSYKQRREEQGLPSSSVSTSGPRGTNAQQDPYAPPQTAEGEADEEHHEEASKHMYPRRDTPVVNLRRKDDVWGVGYVPGATLQVSLGRDLEEGGGPKLAGGFGLGALNEADEDDLDVYDLDSRGGSHRRAPGVAYDQMDVDEEEVIRVGVGMGSSNVGTHSKAKTMNTSSASAARDTGIEIKTHFRDGAPVLVGFVCVGEPVVEGRWFALPEIPEGWKADPRRVWDSSGKEPANSSSNSDAKEGWMDGRGGGRPVEYARWKRGMGADERGKLLGETPLPLPTSTFTSTSASTSTLTPTSTSIPTIAATATATGMAKGARSVFEYMSEKDRERIRRIASGLGGGGGVNIEAVEGGGGGDGGDSARGGDGAIRMEMGTRAPIRVDPHIAQAALKGFQPFVGDGEKHVRYVAFLRACAEGGSGSTSMSMSMSMSGSGSGSVPIPLPRLPTQTEATHRKEMEEFSKAAELFRPVGGAMGGRFMSAGGIGLGPQTQTQKGDGEERREGLWVPEFTDDASGVGKDGGQGREGEGDGEEEEKDPKKHAARMGMYGALTRSVDVWIPNRLLCKRFGVREPDVGVGGPGGGEGERGESMAATMGMGMGMVVTNEGNEKGGEKDEKDGGGDVDMAFATSSFTHPALSLTGGGGGGPRDITNVGLGEDESQGRDTLSYERPGMDVFRAIFCDDDDDDEGSGEGDEAEVQGQEEEERQGQEGDGIGEDGHGHGEGVGVMGESKAEKRAEREREVVDDRPFDPEGFRAMFVRKKGDGDKGVAKENGGENNKDKKDKKDKSKKEKNKKDKRKGGVLVSFEMDEGVDGDRSVDGNANVNQDAVQATINKRLKEKERDRETEKERKRKRKGGKGEREVERERERVSMRDEGKMDVDVDPRADAHAKEVHAPVSMSKGGVMGAGVGGQGQGRDGGAAGVQSTPMTQTPTTAVKARKRAVDFMD